MVQNCLDFQALEKEYDKWMEKQLKNDFQHRSLEERAADFGGELGLDGEYDWGESVGREVWNDKEQ